MNSARNDFLDLLGRLLIAALFLMSGIGKITGYAGTGQYMASAGMPLVELLLPAGIALEIGAALALVVGFQTRLAAFGLIVYTLIATYFFHNFWTMEEPALTAQRIAFMKNMGLIGGLLIVMAAGAGRFSVDARRR